MRGGVKALGAVGAVVALSVGPARHYLASDAPPSILDVHLVDDPAAAPRLPVWPVGVVDTAEALPGGDERPEPPVTPLTYAEATVAAARKDRATVTLVGAPSDVPLLGVGSVITAGDVAYLAALPEPLRTRVVGFLAQADGAALSVTAVDGPATGDVTVVRRGSPASARDALDAHRDVARLLKVWSQVRPDLSALLGSDAPGPDAADVAGASGLEAGASGRGTREASTVARVVTEEILPELDAGHVPLAPALLAARSPGGLLALEDDQPVLTARGAAYAVAARVVQPGVRATPVRVVGPVRARAFARPGGGASVLLWNPGARRTVTVLAPAGDRVLRVRVTVAAGALTGVVLGAR